MAQKNGCDCIWFAFGTGTTFRYLDVTAMAQALGDAKCDGLPAFRALAGCDVTTSFVGKGKRTTWTAWAEYMVMPRQLCVHCQECQRHKVS